MIKKVQQTQVKTGELQKEKQREKEPATKRSRN